MKKNLKEKSLELLKDYLKKHNSRISNAGFYKTSYYIKELKKEEKYTDSYVESYLEATHDELSNIKGFYSFIKEMLATNNKDVALSQLIKKTPRRTSYEYDSKVKEIINVLKPYKQELFEYAIRKSFLEGSWEQIGEVFNVIDDQEKRTAIFEVMLTTKAFQELDVQKKLYFVFSENIKNKKILEGKFTKISNVEIDSVIESEDVNSVFNFSINHNKLNSATLSSNSNWSNILYGIKRLLEEMVDDNQIGIKNIIIEEKNIKYNPETKFNVITNNRDIDMCKFVIKEIVKKYIDAQNMGSENVGEFNLKKDLIIETEKRKYWANHIESNIDKKLETKIKERKSKL